MKYFDALPTEAPKSTSGRTEVATFNVVTVVAPPTLTLSNSTSPLISTLEETFRVVPLKVSCASSLSSPFAPANTIRVFVRSLICAESATNPLVVLSTPANVDTPETFRLSSSVCPSTSM